MVVEITQTFKQTNREHIIHIPLPEVEMVFAPQFRYNNYNKNVLGVVTMAKGIGKVLAQNKKASHDYFIEETIEAGMVLTGTEIKSVRNARVQLKESYVSIRGGEAWIRNMHISPFDQGNRFNHDPLRERKLLLHKKQISELVGAVKRDGYTIVPLKMYIKDGYAKLLIGLGKGKKDYDKRNDMKKKEAKREMERTFKSKNQ